MKLKLIEFFDHFDDNGVGGYQGCAGRTQSQAASGENRSAASSWTRFIEELDRSGFIDRLYK